MFKCGKCGKSKQHGRMVTLETRSKEYVESRMERGREILEVKGHGEEIVREQRHCNECIEAVNA